MSIERLLARLARLDESDRAWLLGELSPALRHELIELLAQEDREPVPVAPVAPREGWESLDPARAARALEGEPAWLVSAATRGSEAHWRERFLKSMTTRRRHDIEMEDRADRQLGMRAAKLLLDGCRRRVADDPQPLAATPRSGFSALLDQMRSRFA